MATFEAKTYRINIEPHPNADAIELAVIGGYRSIVKKDQYRDGDLVVYIPEAAVLPEWILKKLDFWDNKNEKGKLNGPKGDRVKAIRLRGVLSQGIIFPLEYKANDESQKDWVLTNTETLQTISIEEGTDVTEFMGIVKYEPPIPVHMAGEVFNAHGMTLKFDIENVKKWPDILKDGEDVVMTEKGHGTWCCLGYHPNSTVPIVTSKGLSEKGLAFKINEANTNNLYINALRNTRDSSGDDVVTKFKRKRNNLEPFYILGEIIGAGIQDLTYGGEKPHFIVFDVYVGLPGLGRYLNWDELTEVCELLQLQMVPRLYKGPFSVEKMLELTDGKETISGKQCHIREGIVIKPTIERYDNYIGRVVLKSVSDAYLSRKNGTEYN